MTSLPSQFHIAIVDDNVDCLNMMEVFLSDERLKLFCYRSPEELHQSIRNWKKDSTSPRQTPFDLVISDIEMPNQSGIDLFKTIKPYLAGTPVIFVTAHESVDSAVQALQLQASDYIKKPFTKDKLKQAVYRALPLYAQVTQSEQEVAEDGLSKEIGIIGESPRMRHLFSLLKRVARTDSNILITGESGSGKEMVAKALHKLSRRSEKPFVAVNCAALPETLLESELFGYARGAFTGANTDRKGLFEAAEGGTLFLDEIGEMEPGLQAKLLRVLQERKVRPLGRIEERSVNCRVICATHQNLRKAISNGSFREDLYFRLSVIPLEIPALRHRKQDILPLAEYFLAKFSQEYKEESMHLSQHAISMLEHHTWPGNVRELQNTIERAVVLSQGRTLEASDLYLETDSSQDEMDLGQMFNSMSLEEVEKEYIKYALQTYGGKKTKAAELLGMDRKTLYRKEKKYFGPQVNPTN